jgi:hypothetical protein
MVRLSRATEWREGCQMGDDMNISKAKVFFLYLKNLKLLIQTKGNFNILLTVHLNIFIY